jgi:proline iminopeptidase
MGIVSQGEYTRALDAARTCLAIAEEIEHHQWIPLAHGTLGIPHPTILGHSFGGFVALTLAVRHPDVVGRLILMNTAAATADMADAMGTIEQRYGPEARATAERMFSGDFTDEVTVVFARYVAPVYVHDPANVGLVGEFIQRTRFNPEVAGHYFGKLAGQYDVRARLNEIRVPTLVVAGETDWLCPPSTARVIANGIPKAEIIVIPQAGHFAMWEQPEFTLSAVRPFLASPKSVGGI